MIGYLQVREIKEKIPDLLFCRKGAMITEDTKYFPWLIIVKTVCMLILLVQ
jgi:hypothetical protein